jgi:CRP-like cAMP-binding protein
MSTQVLRTLPEAVAVLVERASRRRRYSANEVIFHAGDPADCLHIVTRGHVAILVTTPLGQQLAYTIHGPKESFGELALLSGQPYRSATARALETTETLVLRAADLQALRRDHPNLNDVLLQVVCQHVLRVSNQLTEFLYLPVESRVRRRILDLCGKYAADDGRTVIPLSQDELAALAGAARATVNRVLRQDETAGIVALERRRVIVLDQNRLRVRAGAEVVTPD